MTIAEGFGGPYTTGAADIGTAVIYAVFFAGLLALMAYAGPARYSVDYYLEQKISWWYKVAELGRPVQNVPAPAASTPGVPQPRTAQPVTSATAVTASPAGPAGPAASDGQVPAGRTSA